MATTETINESEGPNLTRKLRLHSLRHEALHWKTIDYGNSREHRPDSVRIYAKRVLVTHGGG